MAIPYQHGGPSLAKNSPELLRQTQGSGHGTRWYVVDLDSGSTLADSSSTPLEEFVAGF